jgi:hypothetical protein
MIKDASLSAAPPEIAQTAKIGASNIDPYATAGTRTNQWVVEGPHLMVIEPDTAQLEGLSTDPHSGGPYVMWKGTPYAHIMVPVAERPKQ